MKFFFSDRPFRKDFDTSNPFNIFVFQITEMNSLEHRFMMNRLGRRLYHCLMFYAL